MPRIASSRRMMTAKMILFVSTLQKDNCVLLAFHQKHTESKTLIIKQCYKQRVEETNKFTENNINAYNTAE